MHSVDDVEKIITKVARESPSSAVLMLMNKSRFDLGSFSTLHEPHCLIGWKVLHYFIPQSRLFVCSFPIYFCFPLFKLQVKL